ncbi:unnamed protein product [Symbiodinium sp. KB8]|nr:unnamed protein product [Symbiodinium sp. KB8]
MAPGMAAAQMGATWSPLHAAGFHDLSPRIPQDRNPLQMLLGIDRLGMASFLLFSSVFDGLTATAKEQQSQTDWAARRPLSASKANRLIPVGGLILSVVACATSFAMAGHIQLVAASTSTAAVGAGVTQRPPGMLQPQRIELPSYLNTPARRPDGEPLLPEERTVTLRKMKDFEMLTFACRRASKLREEGRAHFSLLGVLRDNLGQYQKAKESESGSERRDPAALLFWIRVLQGLGLVTAAILHSFR